MLCRSSWTVSLLDNNTRRGNYQGRDQYVLGDLVSPEKEEGPQVDSQAAGVFACGDCYRSRVEMVGKCCSTIT
jgi:hypothetical protein